MKNWKIYKNEKYGFEFKYPENWDLAEIDYKEFPPEELVVYIHRKPTKFLESRPPAPEDKPVIAFIITKGNPYLPNEDWQDFSLGNIKGFLKIEEVTSLKERDKWFIIPIDRHYCKDPRLPEVINTILLSFKFIE